MVPLFLKIAFFMQKKETIENALVFKWPGEHGARSDFTSKRVQARGEKRQLKKISVDSNKGEA